jgi:hypothetical protein
VDLWVLSSDDAFCINHTVPFGIRPGARICGAILDAAKEFLIAEGMGPIIKWVDDFGFICFLLTPTDETFPALMQTTLHFILSDTIVNPNTPLDIAPHCSPCSYQFPILHPP